MTRYTLGFLFDANVEEVLLIERKKKDWRHMRLNGLGGKIEKSETPLQAMAREFEKETDGAFGEHTWTNFGRLYSNGGWEYEVFLFHAVLDSLGCDQNVLDGEFQVPGWKGTEEGRLVVVNANRLNGLNVAPAVRYLLPMVTNHILRKDSCKYFEIKEYASFED